jgi:PAS domain S-box-containing protein
MDSTLDSVEVDIGDILESITDAFVALDCDARFTYVNRHAERLMHVPREQLLGNRIWDQFPDLLASPMHEQYLCVIRNGRPAEFEEYYPPRQAWLDIRIYPNREGVTAYFRDVSKRKRAEEAQRALVAMVSHDLRNPLFLIKGTAELLHGQPCNDIEDSLDRIDRATFQMTRVVDDLVDLVQLQTGHDIVLEKGPTDLVALARRSVEVHQFSTEAHHIRFESEVDELVGTWDSARLERVLSNLLTNAIKYSPECKDICVHVALSHCGKHPMAELVVADQGIGIPKCDLHLIFERYYRAHNVVGLVPGAGVGLAGARHVIQRHGGTIQVVSREGVGTTFTVRLPI